MTYQAVIKNRKEKDNGVVNWPLRFEDTFQPIRKKAEKVPSNDNVPNRLGSGVMRWGVRPALYVLRWTLNLVWGFLVSLYILIGYKMWQEVRELMKDNERLSNELDRLREKI